MLENNLDNVIFHLENKKLELLQFFETTVFRFTFFTIWYNIIPYILPYKYEVLREFLNENHTPYINHFIIVVKFFEIIYNFIIRRVQDNHRIWGFRVERYLCGTNNNITKTYSKAIQLFTFIPLNFELNFLMNSDSLSSLNNLSKLYTFSTMQILMSAIEWPFVEKCLPVGCDKSLFLT